MLLTDKYTKFNFFQQMFSVRKRSDSNKCFLCESKATATNVFCAKAKRQQQLFSVRKRSDSNNCFLCESEATATTGCWLRCYHRTRCF